LEVTYEFNAIYREKHPAQKPGGENEKPSKRKRGENGRVDQAMSWGPPCGTIDSRKCEIRSLPLLIDIFLI